MKITEKMDEKGLCVGVTLREKDGIFDILIALQQKCGNAESANPLKRALYSSEEESPFAIGAGVVLCSIRSSAVRAPWITAVTAPGGVDFDAPDGADARLIFLVANPPEGEDPSNSLRALLLNENLREQLINAADESTFLNLLHMAEMGTYANPAEPSEEFPLILAVVPREAAAGLQLAAGRLGLLLRASEQCSSFTEQELQDAHGVLLVEVEEQPIFYGLPLLKASSSDAYYRPEYLLRQMENAPICRCKPKTPPLRLWCGLALPSPLLPILLLLGGAALWIGEALSVWQTSAFLASAVIAFGKGSLAAVLPITSGLVAYRYAGWNGLAAGVLGGLLATRLWGGVVTLLIGTVINAIWLLIASKTVHMK